MSNPNTLKAKRKALAIDANNNALPITLPSVALAQTRDTSISASTEITLDADTSIIEITALTDNVFLKYGTDDVTNANFDEFIQAGVTRHYVIPQDITAINLIDDGSDATIVVIEK